MARRLKAAISGLRKFGGFLGRTANLMVGMPHYETYAEHRRACHPGAPIMSREEFFRERQAARYGGGKSRFNRCC